MISRAGVKPKQCLLMSEQVVLNTELKNAATESCTKIPSYLT